MNRPTDKKRQTPIPKKAKIIEVNSRNDLIDSQKNYNTKQIDNNVELKKLRVSTKRTTPVSTSKQCKNYDLITTNKQDCDFEAKICMNENKSLAIDNQSVYNKIISTDTDGIENNCILQHNVSIESIKINENTGIPLYNVKSGPVAILYNNTVDETASRVDEYDLSGNDSMKYNRDEIMKENCKLLVTGNSTFHTNLTEVIEKTLKKCVFRGSFNTSHESNRAHKTHTITCTNIIKNEYMPMEELAFGKANNSSTNNEIQLCIDKSMSSVNMNFNSKSEKAKQEKNTFNTDASANEIADEVTRTDEKFDPNNHPHLKTEDVTNGHNEDEVNDILLETDNCDNKYGIPVDKTSDSDSEDFDPENESYDPDNEGYDPADDMSLKALIDLYSDEVKQKLEEETQLSQWRTPCLEDTHLDVPEPINGEYICQHCNGKYGTEYDFTTHKCSNKPCTDFTAFNKTLKKSRLLSPEPMKMDIDKKIRRIKADGRTSRKGDDIGPYVCYICKKTICRRSGLNVHVRRHLKDTPYECEYCKKRFVVLYDLDRHTATHLGGKRFRFMCELCVRPFVSKCSLIQHMKIVHCKKASFTCKICMIPFPQEFRLKRHILQHIEYDINQSTVIDESLKILESIEQTKEEMSQVLDESLKEIDLNEAELLSPEQSQMELLDLQQSGVIDETLAVIEDPSVKKRSNIIEQCLKLADIQESDGIDFEGPTSSNEIQIELIDLKEKSTNNEMEIVSSNVIDVVNPSIKLFPLDNTDSENSNQAIKPNDSIKTCTQKTMNLHPTIEVVPLERKKHKQLDIKRSNTINELHNDTNEFNIFSDSMDLESTNLLDMDLFDMSDSNISEVFNGSDLDSLDILNESEIIDIPNQSEMDILDCINLNDEVSASKEIVDLTKPVLPVPLNKIDVIDMDESSITTETEHKHKNNINLADEPDKPKKIEIVDLTELNDEVEETIELSDSDEPTAVDMVEKHTVGESEAVNEATQNTLQEEQSQSNVDRTIVVVAIHHTYIINNAIEILNVNCVSGNGSGQVSNAILLL